jgi:hypothetical protein
VKNVPPLMNFRAETEADLEAFLYRFDIDVPARNERHKRHGERYAIMHLLDHLLAEQRLSYPLHLEQRDRPDFVLTMGSAKIAIEHVEAIPENQAHEDARWASGVGSPGFARRHLPTDARKKKKDIDRQLKRDKHYLAYQMRPEYIPTVAIPPGWVGDEPEIEWAGWIDHFIGKKLNNPCFEQHSKNWLLIYYNLRLPKVDYEKSAQKLLDKLASMSSDPAFDEIFILLWKKICRIVPRHRFCIDLLP